jgi:hypothetical protein
MRQEGRWRKRKALILQRKEKEKEAQLAADHPSTRKRRHFWFVDSEHFLVSRKCIYPIRAVQYHLMQYHVIFGSSLPYSQKKYEEEGGEEVKMVVSETARDL